MAVFPRATFASDVRFANAKSLVARAVLFGAVCLLAVVSGASAALPDDRSYELVSPVQENAVTPYAAVPSLSGQAVDFQARGAFAGASSGSLNLYQATRTATGWQTAPLTPTPSSPLGPLEEQVPVFYSPDLSQTIFTTPASYAPGDSDGGALDLYLRSPEGSLTWLSQGAEGGGEPDEVSFDAATPDAGSVVFSTAEPLLAAATPLEAGDVPQAEYLYDRVVSSGETQLLDVDEAGQLLGSAVTALTASVAPGASELTVASTQGFRAGESVVLGSGAAAEPVRVERIEGRTLLGLPEHAGPKNPHSEGEPVLGSSAGAVLGDGTTLTTGPPPADQYVPADVTGSTTHAISAAGNRVFFESPSPESHQTVSLYVREDNATTVLIAQSATQAQPSEQVRYEGASEDGSLVFFTSAHGLYEYETPSRSTLRIAPSVLGVSAISNDGSYVFFLSESKLAENVNSHGAGATEGSPNLYAYNTATQAMTFIATMAQSDVTAEGGGPAGLIAEPDIDRPAVPTADGSVLVFAAHGNLTGQNPRERYTEIYRYSVPEEQLVCVSCTRAGVEPTGNASFGETAGGSYDPPGLTSPMSANGAEVFFDTPDSLLPEDENGAAPPNPLTGEPSSTDVYEWEAGQVHLISCGCTASPSTLMGTTPSANDVFFTTTAKLVPQATGFTSLYDARVGGGFPPPPSGTAPSCPSGCREPFPAPPTFEAPPSTTVQPSGNLPAATPAKPKPKPVVCRKGFVKKKVKRRTLCVKQKAKATATRRGSPRPRSDRPKRL